MLFRYPILAFLFVRFVSGMVYSQCDTINLGNDTILCEGQELILDAGAGFSSYLWNTGNTDQFLTITEPGDYWCSVEDVDSTNLVDNGDFSSGNTGFSTDYVWGIGGPWGILSEEGTYVIDVNAALTHVNFDACVDHTTGEGLYMIINGDTAQGENVWCQSVVVEPNMNYLFSGWFTSVHPSNPAILSYFINGVVIETVYLDGNTCLWENFIKQWYSAENSIAEICIINQNTEMGGNDFGIDDIHLLKLCPSIDTINVSFDPGPVIELGNDTVLCEGQELLLNVGAGYTNYLWSNGSTDSSVVISFPGIVWVEVINENGCTGSDTIFVEISPGIELNIGSDTTICPNGIFEIDAGSGYANYIWQDSTNNQLYEVFSPGTYWVTVFDENGCSGSDTITVELSPPVVVDLGNDTTICLGEDLILEPGNNFYSYYWQDGSTGSTYTVEDAGMYAVIVTDQNGCFGYDTINVSLSPSPEVFLGNDTTLCLGNTLVLDPGSQFSSYMWQDNSTFPVFSVSTTGYYNVTVTNIYNCPGYDEIFIEIASPEIDLGTDTSLCSSDTLILDPGQGYTNYLWQDNSTGSYFNVTSSDVYTVEVTDDNNCSSYDEVDIEVMPTPEIDLYDTLSFCTGETLTIELPDGPFDYYWNGEQGGSTMQVNSQGFISIVLSNACGSATKEIEVFEFPVPEIFLGEDQIIYPGESIELNAGNGFDNYIWQDGSNDQSFTVIADNANPNNPYYYVEVSNGPCKSSDTIKIEVFVVKVPNVITPNGDGFNDDFMPMDDSWSGINKHHIEIFNRWGEKVWESDNFEKGWDGTRNGRIVASGTYYWILDVYYGDNLKKSLKGAISVIVSGE